MVQGDFVMAVQIMILHVIQLVEHQRVVETSSVTDVTKKTRWLNHPRVDATLRAKDTSSLTIIDKSTLLQGRLGFVGSVLSRNAEFVSLRTWSLIKWPLNYRIKMNENRLSMTHRVVTPVVIFSSILRKYNLRVSMPSAELTFHWIKQWLSNWCSILIDLFIKKWRKQS